MTSKILFFKCMRENTKQRLWSIALIALVLFFLFPVLIALEISEVLSLEALREAGAQVGSLELAKERVAVFFHQWCSVENVVLSVWMIFFAIVCGVSGFSWLHSRKKTDFYHSLPVRREVLFGANCLNGILYVAVPYFVFLVIAGFMVQGKGIDISWSRVLQGYLLHMAFYLLVYAVVIAAVILTGNTLVSLLGTVVFFSWGPGCITLLQAYFSEYFVTFYNSGEFLARWVKRSSPVAWYIAASGVKEPAVMAGWALLFAGLILVLSLVLYRKRPSEAAGRAMAFAVSQPVIKFLLVIPLSLLGSLLFHSMMNRDSWALFGLVCGLVISSCVIEIIYHFDFRSLFAHKVQLLICGFCAAAVLAVFRLDLAGYDSYLPTGRRVVAAGIYSNRMESDVLNQYLAEVNLGGADGDSYRYVSWRAGTEEKLTNAMKLLDLEDVTAIARQGVEDAASYRSYRLTGGRNQYEYMEQRGGQDSVFDRVFIAWHLDSGKTVYRVYDMDLKPVAENLDRISSQEAYKKAIYPVLSYQVDDIAGVNYQEENFFRHVTGLNPEKTAELLSAYQKELGALTVKTRRNENPVAALQFKTKSMQEMIDIVRASNGNYEQFNQIQYFPVYPSFTETIAILKECGIQVGEIVNPNTVKQITMTYTGVMPEGEMAPEDTELGKKQRRYRETGDGIRVTVTDPDQIRQILDASVSEELDQTNSLNPEYTGIQITAYVKNENFGEQEMSEDGDFPETENGGEEITVAETVSENFAETESAEEFFDESGEYIVYGLHFDEDRIPSFVKTEFGLTEAMIQEDTTDSY